MTRVSRGIISFENELLAKLPKSEFERLARHLQVVEFAKEQILYEIGEGIKHVYFPIDSLISLMARANMTPYIEVSAAGTNGMVGIPAILHAHRMPFRV